MLSKGELKVNSVSMYQMENEFTKLWNWLHLRVVAGTVRGKVEGIITCEIEF